MNFLRWFRQYPYFYTIGWPSIIAVGAIFELLGFFSRDGSTFSTLVRAVLPKTRGARIAVVLAIVLFLFWHFAVQKVNYQ